MKPLMGDLLVPSNYYLASSPNHRPAMLPSTTEQWAIAEKVIRQIIFKVHPTDVSEETRRQVIGYIYRLIRARTGCEPESILRKDSINLMPFGKIDGIDLEVILFRSQVIHSVVNYAKSPGLEGIKFLEVSYTSKVWRTSLASAIMVFPYGSVPLRTYLPDGDIDLTAFGGAISEDVLADDIFSLLEREERNRDTEFIVKDVQLIRAEVKIVKCIVQNVVVDISLNQIGGLCTLCFLEQVDRLIGKDHLFKHSIILIKAWCYYESRLLGAPHGLISTYALETLILYIFNLFHSVLDGPLAVLYKFLEHFSKFDWDNYCISLNGPVLLASFPELRAEMPENGGVDLLLSNEFLRNCVGMYSVPSRGGDLSSRTFQLKHLNIIDPLKENNNLGRSVSKGNFYRIRSAFTFGARKLDRILMQPESHLDEELKKYFENTLERHGSEQKTDVHGSFPAHSNGHRNGSYQVFPSDRLTNRNVVDQQTRMLGDAKDLATYKSGIRKVSSAEAKNRDLNGENVSSLGLEFAPHLYISKPSAHPRAESENLDTVQSQKLNGYGLENDDIGKYVASEETPEYSDTLSDLTGDYKTHFQGLQYARWRFDYPSSAPPMPISSPSFQFQNPWVAVQRPTMFTANDFSHSFVNGVIPNPPFYPGHPQLVPGMNFGSEGMQKPRGTGTYFPNPNRPGQVAVRPPTAKERRITSRPPGNGRSMKFIETNTVDQNNRKLSQPAELVEQSRAKLGLSKNQRRTKGHSNSNGFAVDSEGSLDFGSIGHESTEAPPVLERSRQWQQKVSPTTPTGDVQTPPVLERNRQCQQKVSPTTPTGDAQTPQPDDDYRVLKKSSYHLKDAGDFPPLSM